jgi:septal ring factor EnvC (AmiA/AmiB activator)
VTSADVILALKPVTFHYKSDKQNTPQFGLIAEQVEKVNPDLVVRDEDGKIMTVRYEAVNAMLLNEFLKEHQKVEEQEARLTKQEATIAQQQKDFQGSVSKLEATVAALIAIVQEQASLIQNVSDQIEASKAARQLVADNQ